MFKQSAQELAHRSKNEKRMHKYVLTIEQNITHIIEVITVNQIRSMYINWTNEVSTYVLHY